MRSKFIPDETVEALKKVLGSEAWLPFQVSLETGLRIGDVLRLRSSDLTESDGGYILRYTAQKTGKEGEAKLSRSTGKKLCRRKGFLFPGRGHSGHLTRQAAWARIKRACDAAQIDPGGVSPHSLRKCFAVELRHEKGLEAVKEALQHSNDAVTRVYAYADSVMKGDADEPIRWRDLELICEYILDRIREGD